VIGVENKADEKRDITDSVESRGASRGSSGWQYQQCGRQGKLLSIGEEFRCGPSGSCNREQQQPTQS
jgi:hypothetical protein